MRPALSDALGTGHCLARPHTSLAPKPVRTGRRLLHSGPYAVLDIRGGACMSRHWSLVTFVSRDQPDAAALDSLRGDPADGSAQLSGTAWHRSAPPGTASSNSNPPDHRVMWVRPPGTWVELC